MLLQPQTTGDFDTFTPKGTVTPKREKPGHTYQKDNDLLDGLPKEVTVLGTIQILCCLMISSLGVILVSAHYSSHFNLAVSNILMSGYPFVGALCFAISGCLSIISREKSTKLCEEIISIQRLILGNWTPKERKNQFRAKWRRMMTLSSLISNAVSSLTAGAGLFLLADGMVAVGTAFQHCDSEKDYLSSSPYSEYYYPMYEVEDCRLSIATVTGVLVVMLTFTVLELLLAAYTSVFWWKRFYANNPGSEFSLP
uniref:Membrane spanning 4-domains A7 n=1 Tax=Microcebus murinus TaxID=30608 RepID=A0A8B7FTP2_MICMU|nr:membrane-spanning 4-domains subfamily A member 7 isoform X1 [Microcebus murinus]